MDTTFWHKQASESLYPDLEWNKPERRDHAGSLLIIGGDLHNLNAPAKSFEIAKKTGIGTTQLALPDKTKRLLGNSLPDALFLPSTASGEFSHSGEVELLNYALAADALLMPGDNGRNSETTILFESLLRSYSGLAILTRDAVDILTNTPASMLEREKTTLVITFAQLQKLVKSYGETTPLTFSMDLIKLVEFLHLFSQKIGAAIITLHQNQFIVAAHGQISTTKIKQTAESEHWRIETATIAACFQTWNPNKPFEALTHSVSLLY